ncbi:hypothetical protein SEA_MACGULLY_3 [Rhodococcus phage MacGully]|nr:hypothetical protein SEA_MACGULLY_3 [Rhodococcus phage MacGully]
MMRRDTIRTIRKNVDAELLPIHPENLRKTLLDVAESHLEAHDEMRRLRAEIDRLNGLLDVAERELDTSNPQRCPQCRVVGAHKLDCSHPTDEKGAPVAPTKQFDDMDDDERRVALIEMMRVDAGFLRTRLRSNLGIAEPKPGHRQTYAGSALREQMIAAHDALRSFAAAADDWLGENR